MHMARLWNTARFQNGGYSLEALTADLLHQRKKPMKELFGVPKLKKVGHKTLLILEIRQQNDVLMWYLSNILGWLRRQRATHAHR